MNSKEKTYNLIKSGFFILTRKYSLHGDTYCRCLFVKEDREVVVYSENDPFLLLTDRKMALWVYFSVIFWLCKRGLL